MKDLNYGKGYQYAHDKKDKLTNMQCLPDSLKDRVYYQPTEQGFEAKYKERLKQIKNAFLGKCLANEERCFIESVYHRKGEKSFP